MPWDIVDPVSSATVFQNVDEVVSSPYTDADDAYNSWASDLGVSNTGSDPEFTLPSAYTDPAWQPINFSPINGAYNKILLTQGGIAIWMTPPSTDATAYDNSTTYSGEGDVEVIQWVKPTRLPCVLIGAKWDVTIVDVTQYIFKLYDLKMRSMRNTSPPSDEVIGIYTRARSNNVTDYDIRIAFRLRPGYIEMFATFGDPPSGKTGSVYWITGNESTNAGAVDEGPFNGKVLNDDVHIASDDTGEVGRHLTDGAEMTFDASSVIAVSDTLSESVTVSDALLHAWGIILPANITIAASTAYLFRPGAVIDAAVSTVDTIDANGIYGVSINEAAELLATISSAYPAVISSTVTVSEAFNVARGVLVAERVIGDLAVVPKGKYGTVITQALLASDSLRRFLAGDLVANVVTTDSISRQFTARQTLSETVTTTLALSASLIMRVVLSDTVVTDAEQLVSAIWNGVLNEETVVEMLHISPSGDVTTWVLNTRTGSMVNYTNFDFNSFARKGNRYLAASSQGLYVLDGDDDDGDNVLPVLASGFAQFNGSRFAAIGSVYIGLHGTGQFVLKIITGDGKEYHYAVTAKDRQTTRVNIGKGLRARYFRYELISTDGGDFDLDSIEFRPVAAQRHV